MGILKWINDSLRRKLSLFMLITTLLPLISLGCFAYIISSRSTEEKTKQSGINTLAQMGAKLRFIVKDVENMSIYLIGQQDIQEGMKGQAEDAQARARILGTMTNLVYSKSYISSITIYPVDGKEPISTSASYSSELKLDFTQVREKQWTGRYGIENYAGSRQVISFIRPLRSVNNYDLTFGWLVISLDEEAVSRNWTEPRLNEGQGQVILLNEKAEILSATDKRLLAEQEPFPAAELIRSMGSGSGALTYGERQDRKTLLHYRDEATGWTLVGVIPFDLYWAENRFILVLTGAAVIVSVLLTVGLTLFVVQRVTNPLRALTRLLSKINPDEPLPTYPIGAADEIGRLAASYNRLGTHIESLKKRLILQESRKKEADMRALQAQINPHFLYNTLSSIHWIALMEDQQRIAEMVGALSDFLRFSLNRGKEYCSVDQELAHIRNYAVVQSIRFPDEFEVDYTVDEELGSVYMLKLLLQPLVENAMIHGIQKKGRKGQISIHVERQGADMSFIVLDDGAGMSEERLEQVRSSMHPSSPGEPASDASYGLRNVHERLLLHYGPDAGLQIESREGVGTRISFKIPRLEGPHENHDRG
ncbi:sensor histidine kinase [Paenibacillus puerhi]|uniref:sensor histidine kinase n=1 Tax=Paenibacillus puerhi TaxID=2692622 RepID=UPI002E2C1B18|nr:sensor histidine kinase [Paenibacillus puerhi]